MAGRISAAVERALLRVAAGSTLSDAARAEQVAVTSVRRAMRRAGEPPRAAFCPPARRRQVQPMPAPYLLDGEPLPTPPWASQ